MDQASIELVAKDSGAESGGPLRRGSLPQNGEAESGRDGTTVTGQKRSLWTGAE